MSSLLPLDLLTIESVTEPVNQNCECDGVLLNALSMPDRRRSLSLRREHTHCRPQCYSPAGVSVPAGLVPRGPALTQAVGQCTEPGPLAAGGVQGAQAVRVPAGICTSL